jgi:hypothetical protein
MHAVLVDAGLVGEGVGAHDGLAGRDGHAGDVGEQLAALVDLPGVDARLGVVEIPAGPHGHDDLLQAGVARPLADAVDRALHLGGARLHAGQRVGHGHAQVVVAVDGDVHLVDARHVFAQVGDEVAHLLGRGVAHGVGDVQRGGAGGDGVGVALGQESPVGAGGVLGGELDVVALGLGVGHHLADAVQHLLAGHLSLYSMWMSLVARKTWMRGCLASLHRLPRRVDVALGAAGQAGHGAVVHRGGDGLHALEVHGGGDGEAGLDHIHAQGVQLPGHLHLLTEIHAAAGGLLAVPQGGVKNFDASHVFLLVLIFLSQLRAQ